MLAHRRHKRKSPRNEELKDGNTADYRSLKPELGTDAETQRYELHGDTNVLELDAVDTSYLEEMGTELDDVSRGEGIMKIPVHNLDGDLIVVTSKDKS